MLEGIVGREWDVLVVGTGIGGATLGRRLAERGLSVLFLEQGPDAPREESHGIDPDLEDPEARLSRGFWPSRLEGEVDGRASAFFAPLGSGVGGSSVFYAACLERPERHDLEHMEDRPHPTGGWPVGYAAFRPYFEAAEGLFHVCGTADPLSPEPPPSLAPHPEQTPLDLAMAARLRRLGLNPYRMHTAIRYLPDCANCLGRKCPRPCKMDARSAGIEPALKTGRAVVLDRTRVTALRGRPGEITHVEARRGGETLVFRARRYVLAAGALSSPGLLLASAAEPWPEGCGNAHGRVGRGLMFHLNELIALWPPRGDWAPGPTRTLALRDFYFHEGRRFGVVQAMGFDAAYGVIHHYLSARFQQAAPRALHPLRHGLRIPAWAAARIFGSAKVFAAILEDPPRPENRVLPDASGEGRIRFTYGFSPELLARRRAFRRLFRTRLKGERLMFLNPGPELNFGHPCGTLPFGRDPRTSALDPECRPHGVENLHVADASFMPTSAGVNPSLTIAANALRVADAAMARLGRQATAG